MDQPLRRRPDRATPGPAGTPAQPAPAFGPARPDETALGRFLGVAETPAGQGHGPDASRRPTAVDGIVPDGGPAADLAAGTQVVPDMLADALVRHMFALSMDLHRILGRISDPAEGPGRPRPAGTRPIGQGGVHAHPHSEELRRILHQAIAELDRIVHRTRSLVFAHLDGTTPAGSGADRAQDG